MEIPEDMRRKDLEKTLEEKRGIVGKVTSIHDFLLLIPDDSKDNGPDKKENER